MNRVDALDRALEDAKRRFVTSNPRGREQHERAIRVLPGGNTRSILFSEPFPVVLSRGRDARVWSIDGTEYVDFLGEYTAGLYGHSHPAIVAAIRSTLESGTVLGGHNVLEEQLASLICGRFPAVERVRFTNSGTEANLLALATARAVTGRRKIVVFEGGYHGGVLIFGSVQRTLNVPYEFLVCKYNDWDRTASILDANQLDIAAVLIEPMQGSAGCIPGKDQFLQALASWCQGHGVLLILDEVMTSRLSPAGLQGILGISPDLTTFGKYLGGGMSFGAFGGRADIMDRFDPRRVDALYHAGTFNNNVVTMSAGVAGLSQAFTPESCVRINALGRDLRRNLNEMVRRADVGMQFTGSGSMMNAHFRSGEILSVEELRGTDRRLYSLFYLDMLEAGVWLAPRGMLNLSLPMGQEEIERLIEAFRRFLLSRSDLIGSGVAV